MEAWLFTNLLITNKNCPNIYSRKLNQNLLNLKIFEILIKEHNENDIKWMDCI